MCSPKTYLQPTLDGFELLKQFVLVMQIFKPLSNIKRESLRILHKSMMHCGMQ
jgi:hypothetical protein